MTSAKVLFGTRGRIPEPDLIHFRSDVNIELDGRVFNNQTANRGPLHLTMATDEEYITLAARLNSFENPQPLPGRKKAKKWPHQQPNARSLSEAGFFFKPSVSVTDNCECYLCGSNLANWEADDVPLEEHLKHAPSCGIATVLVAAQDSSDPALMEDPTSARLVEARRATFLDRWPHEEKRGWLCKTEKMVNSGWVYAATAESDDFVTCLYCKLSLDGFEPKDSPWKEHYKRSPDCPFFVFAGTTEPKATKGKKGRTSKASRLSTQSNLTTASEAPSIPDLDDSIDTSTLSVSTIASTASKMGNKKSTRGKGKAKKAEAIEAIEPATVQESPQSSTNVIRGKKRPSDQINEDDRGARESTVKPEPPSKRRDTRTRSSVMEQVTYPAIDTETAAPEEKLAALKPARGGRKRASSQNRKLSAASTASLRAKVADNATIEAQLEADLDRPMSDEEEVGEKEAPAQVRGKNANTITASTAPIRDEVHVRDALGADKHVLLPEEQEKAKPDSYETETEGPVRSKSIKSRGGRKPTKKQAHRLQRGSDESMMTTATDLEPQVESSMLTARTEADDSGHETDGSVAGKSVVRKGGKRKAPAKGRGKKKASGLMSKNIEDIVQSHPAESVPVPVPVPVPGLTMPPDNEGMEVETVPPNVEEYQSEQPVSRAKPSKAKTTKAKKAKTGAGAPQLSMPGAFSPLMREQDVEPSFASVLSPNSPPVRPGPAMDQVASPGASIPPPLPPRSPLREASARPTPTPHRSAQRTVKETTPSPSPQSSDAENVPPSSRPASTRPPLTVLSPSQARLRTVPLAPGTPCAVPLSPSKIGGGLRSDVPWSNIDVELVFARSPNKENENIFGNVQGDLTSPEKKMSVEEWINHNARNAEEKLKAESERVVGVFEKEGARAMRVLEGIEVVD